MPTYPDNWDELRNAAYERAGWRCEHCGITFIVGTTLATHERNAIGLPIILTVHHIDGDTSHNEWVNLLACCQRCHLHIQASWKPGGIIPPLWGEVPEWIIKRGLPFQAMNWQPRLEGL